MENNTTNKSNLIRDIKSGNHELRDKAIKTLRKNGWLYDDSLLKVDLRNADLSGADLTGARFYDANLDGVNLRKSTLTGARFDGASLKGADLSDSSMRVSSFFFADLQGATLIGCDAGRSDFSHANMADTECYYSAFWSTKLASTNLTSSDLRFANLRGALLTNTILDHARLGDASIGNTTFSGIDFRHIRELNEVEYWKPCQIDIDSLYLSQGLIPKDFLHGCGIPDTMITYMKSIVNASQPFEFFKIFLSFSGEDDIFAEKLFQSFKEGDIKCWKYDRQQHLGADLYDNIDAGFKSSEKVVLISSASAWNSSYVLDEIKYALKWEKKSKELILIPITIDDTLDDPQNFLMNIVSEKIYASFQGWEEDESIFENGFRHLLTALSKSSTPDT